MRDRQVLDLELAGRPGTAAEALGRAFPAARFAVREGKVRAESAEALPVGPLVHALEEQGIEVTEARRLRPTLEEVFVETTGLEAGVLLREKEKK
ncbi:MAG: hypothetical protein R6X14_04905 [bacterium]